MKKNFLQKKKSRNIQMRWEKWKYWIGQNVHSGFSMFNMLWKNQNTLFGQPNKRARMHCKLLFHPFWHS